MKAKERMKNPTQNFGEGGETDDLVAKKLDIGSGEQYRKEKYISENADEETLRQWDNKDISNTSSVRDLGQTKLFTLIQMTYLNHF